MTKFFGFLPNGERAGLYTISSGTLTAQVTDYGANLVRLLVPDREGRLADVVLGFDTAAEYLTRGGCVGATVGRNANRVGGSRFTLNGRVVEMTPNEGSNNLHSGPDFWYQRMWMVDALTENAITLGLETGHGDQGFPGAGRVQVTFCLEENRLVITYRGKFDRDTVFNMTNHSYFNLAGHENGDKAMDQCLWLRAASFTEVDAASIPTGRCLPVENTGLDFRTPKPLGRDRAREPLLSPQGGIDHNFILEEGEAPAARLTDPHSGRAMEVYTDCPGIQVYCANFLEETGKGGARYGRGSGVCLETQFWPDCMNKPHWPQPVVKANTQAVSVTVFRFTAE